MQSLLLAATIAVRVPRAAIGIASSVSRAAPPRMAAEFRAIEVSSSSAPRPALLFLPGIDGTGRAGASQWPRLATDFDVYGLALPPEVFSLSFRANILFRHVKFSNWNF